MTTTQDLAAGIAACAIFARSEGWAGSVRELDLDGDRMRAIASGMGIPIQDMPADKVTWDEAILLAADICGDPPPDTEPDATIPAVQRALLAAKEERERIEASLGQPATTPTTVRLSPAERHLLSVLAEDLGTSEAAILRRGLALVAMEAAPRGQP